MTKLPPLLARLRPASSIATKLAISFSLVAVFIVSALAALSYIRGRNEFLAVTTAEVLDIAIEKEAAIETWVGYRQSTLSAMAESAEIRQGLQGLLSAQAASETSQNAYDQVLSSIRPWVEGHTGFTEVMVLTVSYGEVVVSTVPESEHKFKADRAYFSEGRQRPFVQNPYHSISLGVPVMVASAPIHSEEGETIGVLAARLDLSELELIINRRSGALETLESYIANTSNLFVTRPQRGPEAVVLLHSVQTAAVDRCLSGESGTMIAADYRNVPVIAAFRWIDERELCLIVKVDQSEALEPVAAFGRSLGVMGGVSAVIAIALGIWLSRTITRPLRALKFASERIGGGDLSVRLPVYSDDELGALARQFNQMAMQLQATVGSLEARVAARTDELRNAVVELRQEVADRKRAELELAQKAEELSRSNEELEQFAYVASHDLQEPLRMVSSYVQLLARRYEGQLDQDADEFIKFAVDGASRMKTLINDLLMFSRVGTRGQTLRPVDTGAALQQAQETLRSRLDAAEAALFVDPLPLVVADQNQMVQLFQNLIGNALKFRRSVPPRIHVRVVDRPDHWRFSVADNGIGIEPAYFERIFVIFQRLHGREAYPGNGIGLAICKKIVERHGGRIWIESEVGVGTTVHFTLPKLAADQVGSDQQPAAQDDLHPDSREDSLEERAQAII